jgi:D-alanyl-D-alanine carboxypeptidase
MRLLKILFAAFFAVMTVSPVSAESVNISATIAVVMDFYTGEILYDKNMERRWIPASTTKSMTAFIVYQEIAAGNLTFDTNIRVSAAAARFSNNRSVAGSLVPLPSGEEISVEVLLRLLMIPSANAAAVVFAEHISGNEEAFVERMNETAKTLGMYAEFTNSHGAYVHYSDAYSAAVLVREFIMQFPDILRITAMPTVNFGGQTYANTNHLVTMDIGVDGFKTGSLRQAGWNHSTTAVRDGRRIIAVLMNAPTSTARQNESRTLLNYGFAELERRINERIGRVRVFYRGTLIPLLTPPEIVNGKLLLPVRDVTGHMGYTTEWHEEHRLVLLTHENGSSSTLFAGRELAVVNGETRILPMSAQIKDGRVYTSLESFEILTGVTAEWNMETGVVQFKVIG